MAAGGSAHLAQRQPWLLHPVECREPRQQHPQEEQQEVKLGARGHGVAESQLVRWRRGRAIAARHARVGQPAP